ncbi:MAG: hypothetical protein BRC55_16100 [Cyanobacteria bacterium SW_8_48_13]|nr:MAG: hypothetical protein BRC55_16100 [Cyanobacteria bacterium SW_8_48_13]
MTPRRPAADGVPDADRLRDALPSRRRLAALLVNTDDDTGKTVGSLTLVAALTFYTGQYLGGAWYHYLIPIGSLIIGGIVAVTLSTDETQDGAPTESVR